MSPSSKRFLLVGLGNPGATYEQSRHNAGWLALDSLVSQWQDSSIPVQWRTEKKLHAETLRLASSKTNGHEYIFLKPDTFMNNSGLSVAAAVKWYLNQEPSQPDASYPHVVVFHDDLDFETGTYKLQFGTGPKVHNGVNSVRDHLHSTQFWSARIGVDSRGGDRSMPGSAYVLQSFSPTEHTAFLESLRTLAEELPYTVFK